MRELIVFPKAHSAKSPRLSGICLLLFLLVSVQVWAQAEEVSSQEASFEVEVSRFSIFRVPSYMDPRDPRELNGVGITLQFTITNGFLVNVLLDQGTLSIKDDTGKVLFNESFDFPSDKRKYLFQYPPGFKTDHTACCLEIGRMMTPDPKAKEISIAGNLVFLVSEESNLFIAKGLECPSRLKVKGEGENLSLSDGQRSFPVSVWNPVVNPLPVRTGVIARNGESGELSVSCDRKSMAISEVRVFDVDGYELSAPNPGPEFEDCLPIEQVFTHPFVMKPGPYTLTFRATTASKRVAVPFKLSAGIGLGKVLSTTGR